MVSEISIFVSGIGNYSNVSFGTSDGILLTATGQPFVSLSLASARIAVIISLSRAIASGIPSSDSGEGRSGVNDTFFRFVAQLVTYG